MDKQEKLISLNEKKWDKWAGTLDDKSFKRKFLRDGQARVVSLLQLRDGVKFLDIGCGTGWAVYLAARSANDAGDFYGVDLSVKMIEKARENFTGRENLHFIQADSRSIPLEDGFFDQIICTHSFHHYPEPEKVMGEIRRLLKVGGRIYILDPTPDTWLGKLIDRIIRIFQREHIKMYSTWEFKDMFVRAGLKYVRAETVKSIEKIHIAEK